MNKQDTESTQLSESDRKTIYKIGGTAALLTVVAAFGEMLVTFLPGGSSPVETVFDWFAQLQGNWFMGLRNLGLLNIVMFILEFQCILPCLRLTGKAIKRLRRSQ